MGYTKISISVAEQNSVEKQEFSQEAAGWKTNTCLKFMSWKTPDRV